MESLSDLSTPLLLKHNTSSEKVGDKKQNAKETRQVRIQLVLFSVTFMLGTSPFMALMNLESIINPEAGVYAMAFVYLGSTLAVFTTPFMRKFLGDKEIVLFGMALTSLFLIAHFYPETYFLWPVSFIFGLFGNFPWWTCHGVYVASLASEYADKTSQPRKHVLALFSGLSYSIVVFYNVWSNLTSSLVFGDYYKSLDENKANDSNLERLCGRHFCPDQTSGTNIIQPNQDTVNILIMAFIAMVSVAFIINLLFLNNTKLSKGETENEITMKQMFKSMFDTVRDYKMFLLLPAVVYIPVSNLLFITEYTQAFIACDLGVQYNGWSVIGYALSQNISSAVAGRLVKYVGYIPLYVFAIGMGYAIFITLLTLEIPLPEDYRFIYFLIPVIWAWPDIVWITQVMSMFPKLFPEATWACFSLYRSFMYIGCTFVFMYSKFVCMTTKIYTTMGLLTFVSICYITFEILHRREEKLTRKVENGYIPIKG